jgi:uncharacterized protein YcgI (DUF1989 family)
MKSNLTIIPAAKGRAFKLTKGQFATIENIHGSQVVDAWVVLQTDPYEYGSMEHTRSVNSNIFLERGMAVVSNNRRPMLSMAADTSPGRHDTLLCPCNAAIYRELRCEGYHRSCTDNFHEALQELGVTLPVTPASLNLFMNVPVLPDGSVDRQPPASRAGDHVVLRAEMDVILVLSACPQDVTPINGTGRKPQDIAVEITDTWPSENDR